MKESEDLKCRYDEREKSLAKKGKGSEGPVEKEKEEARRRKGTRMGRHHRR